MRRVFFTVINNGLEVYNLLVPVKSVNVNQEQKGNCLLKPIHRIKLKNKNNLSSKKNFLKDRFFRENKPRSEI